MKVRAVEKNIEFRVNPAGPLPATISTDPLRLRQILINLIGNAIKFTERGSVELVPTFVEGTEPTVQFDIIDTGIGISEDQSERLFNPFAQADTSMARRFGGTGLGLTISRKLATMLGGGIELIRSSPGTGTTMRATIGVGSIKRLELVNEVSHELAKTSDTSHLSMQSPPKLDAAKPLGGMKVLLAEDGPDNQRLISHLLRKSGAEVQIVENGRAAVQTVMDFAIGNAGFNVILMDMQMPIMDGYEATTALRKNGYHRPIIAVIAHAMGGEKEEVPLRRLRWISHKAN